jgi:hypothetical protein
MASDLFGRLELKLLRKQPRLPNMKMEVFDSSDQQQHTASHPRTLSTSNLTLHDHSGRLSLFVVRTIRNIVTLGNFRLLEPMVHIVTTVLYRVKYILLLDECY